MADQSKKYKFDISNLNLHYGDFHALKDVNMKIEANKITAFIGPSVYGNTKKAAESLAQMLVDKGCEKVAITDLARDDIAEAVEDAFRYDRLVLATTTYNGDVFPFMREFIESLTERNYQKRTIGLIENGSWAATAAKVMRQLFEKSKEITFTETTVKIMSALNEESTTQLENLAEELCK